METMFFNVRRPRKKDNKLSIKDVFYKFGMLDLSVILYLVSIVFADGTILFYTSTVFFILCFLMKRGMPHVNKPFVALSSLFVIYSFLQIFLGFAEYPLTSLNRLFVVSLNYVICILLIDYLDSHINRMKFAYSFVIVMFFFFFYSIVLNASDLFSGRFGDNTRYLFGLSGVNGDFMNSNNVGRNCYMGILFVTVLYSSNKRNLFLSVMLSIVFLLFLILSGSRGALIVGLGFLLLLFITSSDSFIKSVRNIILVFAICLIVLLALTRIDFLNQIIGKRIETLFTGTFYNIDYVASSDGNSAYYRQLMIQEGLEAFAKKPILGWGLFAYSQMDTIGTYTHCNFVEILVSSGTIGFALYYLPLLYIVSKSFFGMKKAKKNRLIYCIIFSFIIIKIVANFFDVDYVSRTALLGFYYLASFLNENKKRTL